MISPEPIWLRKTELTDEGLFLILRVRSNVKQVNVEDASGERHVEYDYDEKEIRYQVPEGVSSLTDLQGLISTKAADIISKATIRKRWEEIQDKPIDDLRKAIRKL
jgi:hypothetical protein